MSWLSQYQTCSTRVRTWTRVRTLVHFAGLELELETTGLGFDLDLAVAGPDTSGVGVRLKVGDKY